MANGPFKKTTYLHMHLQKKTLTCIVKRKQITNAENILVKHSRVDGNGAVVM